MGDYTTEEREGRGEDGGEDGREDATDGSSGDGSRPSGTSTTRDNKYFMESTDGT